MKEYFVFYQSNDDVEPIVVGPYNAALAFYNKERRKPREHGVSVCLGTEVPDVLDRKRILSPRLFQKFGVPKS